jgi:hypothetical protein
MGLYVFPRSVYDAVKENGVKPFFDGMATKRYDMALRGFSNLFSGIVMGLVTNELLKAFTGSSAYTPVDVFSYSPIDPATTQIADAFRVVAKESFLWQRGDKSLTEAVDSAADRILSDAEGLAIPLSTELLNLYETTKDAKGVTFYRLLRKRLVERSGGEAEFKQAERTGKEKLMHMIFDSYETSSVYTEEEGEE